MEGSCENERVHVRTVELEQKLYEAANAGLALARENQAMQVLLKELQSHSAVASTCLSDDTMNLTLTRKLENETASMRAQLADVERVNVDLHLRLDQALDEHKENERRFEKRAMGLQSKIRDYEIELEQGRVLVASLEQDKRRLACDKMELLKQKQEVEQRSNDLEAVWQEVTSLTEALRQSDDERLFTNAQHKQTLQHNEALNERIVTLEEQLNGYEEAQEELAHTRNVIDRLQYDLDEARQTSGKLQAQLAVYLPTVTDETGQPADKENKTLFSEVEDRRQELESQHQALSRQHRGLLRTHTLTVHNTEQMKGHISRLTQLSSTGAHEERIARLERALSQSLSENRELQSKLTASERKVESLSLTSSTNDDKKQDGLEGQSSASARARIIYLESEEVLLRNELHTLRFQKICERDTLTKTEMLLGEREKKNAQLKITVSKIAMELDDMRARLKLFAMKQTSQALLVNNGEVTVSDKDQCSIDVQILLNPVQRKDSETQTTFNTDTCSNSLDCKEALGNGKTREIKSPYKKPELEEDDEDEDAPIPVNALARYVQSPHLKRIESKIQSLPVPYKRRRSIDIEEDDDQDLRPAPLLLHSKRISLTYAPTTPILVDTLEPLLDADDKENVPSLQDQNSQCNQRIGGQVLCVDDMKTSKQDDKMNSIDEDRNQLHKLQVQPSPLQVSDNNTKKIIYRPNEQQTLLGEEPAECKQQ